MTRAYRASSGAADKPAATLIVLLFLLPVHACREPQPQISWTVAELRRELALLERDGTGFGPAEARARLEEFARRAVHATVEVTDGAVMSVYQRGDDWLTRPYFALGYDPASYLYLEEIDAGFQADLAHHPHWASVAHTTGRRQLMFETALDPLTFDRLRTGCRIDFKCELAAVIRGGKSVYCRALATSLLSCDGLAE